MPIMLSFPVQPVLFVLGWEGIGGALNEHTLQAKAVNGKQRLLYVLLSPLVLSEGWVSLDAWSTFFFFPPAAL